MNARFHQRPERLEGPAHRTGKADLAARYRFLQSIQVPRDPGVSNAGGVAVSGVEAKICVAPGQLQRRPRQRHPGRFGAAVAAGRARIELKKRHFSRSGVADKLNETDAGIAEFADQTPGIALEGLRHRYMHPFGGKPGPVGMVCPCDPRFEKRVDFAIGGDEIEVMPDPGYIALQEQAGLSRRPEGKEGCELLATGADDGLLVSQPVEVAERAHDDGIADFLRPLIELVQRAGDGVGRAFDARARRQFEHFRLVEAQFTQMRLGRDDSDTRRQRGRVPGQPDDEFLGDRKYRRDVGPPIEESVQGLPEGRAALCVQLRMVPHFIDKTRIPGAGGAIAVANHIAGFARKVTLLGGLGGQASHEGFIREHLRDNVQPHFFTNDSAHTLVKRRYIGDDAGKLFEVYFGGEALTSLQIEHDIRHWLDSHLERFDAVIVPGGYAPDLLRRYEAVLKLVREAHEQGKVVAAICHAGWVLVSAGILQGRCVTCVSAIKDEVINAGATYLDQVVVQDGNKITSRVPSDLPAFCRTIIAALEG